VNVILNASNDTTSDTHRLL